MEKPKSTEKVFIPETVAASALMYKGEIFSAQNHVLALDKLEAEYPEALDSGEVTEGYLTSHERFVTRKDGLAMHRESKSKD